MKSLSFGPLVGVIAWPERLTLDPRAKTIKSQKMIDTPYLDEVDKSGFFEQISGCKRWEWFVGRHGVLSAFQDRVPRDECWIYQYRVTSAEY